MSSDLAIKIHLGLEELGIIREQFKPLIVIPSDAEVGTIERAAAWAMLHSFYTEIEKIFRLIARDWDGRVPASESWHRDLLTQMAETTGERPAVISSGTVEVLKEFLAFRHLFRGASIVLMRWEKLAPLIAKVDTTYERTGAEIEAFVRIIEQAD